LSSKNRRKYDDHASAGLVVPYQNIVFSGVLKKIPPCLYTGFVLLLFAGCKSAPSSEKVDLAEFVGTYSLPPHGEFNIRQLERRLLCKFSGQEYFELFPVAEDRFRTDGKSYTVFFRNTQREVQGMRWYENGEKEYIAQKTSSVPTDEGTRMVRADGSIYRVKLLGTGSPVVVLESTLGGALETWAAIQTNLANTFDGSVVRSRGTGTFTNSK
jgi:hypothetical protein